MIVDANVLLRLLDGDASPHGRTARERVAAARSSGDALTVMAATVLEVAFVLESVTAGYGWDRAVVAGAIEAVTNEPAFDVEHGDELRAAAATYRDRSIDLHDCLLHHLALTRGTSVLSFDDDLRRLGTGQHP